MRSVIKVGSDPSAGVTVIIEMRDIRANSFKKGTILVLQEIKVYFRTKNLEQKFVK